MIQKLNCKIPFKKKQKIKAVYLIVCEKTNDVYVGSSTNIYRRMGCHRTRLRKGNHENSNLQLLYDAYGEDNFYFKYKYTNYTKYEGLLFEEKFISLFETINIAKEPTKGGSPNKGRKLSDEWKINLHKNKTYKHNETILDKVTKNNKEGACRLLFTKGQEVLEFNSWIEASKHFNISGMHYTEKENIQYKGWKIEKLSHQKKKVLLEHTSENILFNSAGECDRYLNMWRGATSHYLLRDGEICGFKVTYV